MNIMSYHRFYKYPVSTVILSCHSYQVTYHLYKVFVVSETEYYGLDIIPISVKHKKNANNLHNEDSLPTYKAKISSIVDT